MASTAGGPGDGEVLAFDLYGTLVDPAAVAGALGFTLASLRVSPAE